MVFTWVGNIQEEVNQRTFPPSLNLRLKVPECLAGIEKASQSYHCDTVSPPVIQMIQMSRCAEKEGGSIIDGGT